jgi:hypothetical protein
MPHPVTAFVVPAEARTQGGRHVAWGSWAPAFAGVTIWIRHANTVVHEH